MAAQKNVTRDESNILVAIGKLETKFDSMSVDFARMSVEVKDINTGYSARLLNMESNAVSKIEFIQVEKTMNEKYEVHDVIIAEILASRAIWRGQVKAWLLVGGGAWSFVFALLMMWLNKHF